MNNNLNTVRGASALAIQAVQALAPAARQLGAQLKLKSAETYRETVRSAVNGVLGISPYTAPSRDL